MASGNLSGQPLGQYELRDMIGIGGMGAVYLGYQRALDRLVAVKVMQFSLTHGGNFAQRFEREAKTAAALEHPHIVPVIDYGFDQGTSYIVMRYLSGGTLSQRLRQRMEQNAPAPALGEIARLLNQVASALDYAHHQKVIHRDIKTSNIMFDNHGEAYLVDFGIAKLTETTSELTMTGVALGTAHYMAPEQVRGQMVTPATDQYALAVVIYALVAGRMPFEAATPFAVQQRHINDMPTPVHTYRPQTPEAVTLVLERALAKEPGDRFPTVTAFAQAFQSAISGQEGESTGFFAFKVQQERPNVPASPLPPATPTPAAYQHQPTTVQTPPPAAPPPAAPPSSGGRSPLIWIMGGIILVLAVAVMALLASMNNGNQQGGTPVGQAPSQTPAEGVTAEATAEVVVEAASSTPTPRPTDTIAPSATRTPRPTLTPSRTPTVTRTPTRTPRPTNTSSRTPTITRTPRPTATPLPTSSVMNGGVEVTFQDDFNGNGLTNRWTIWNRRPQVSNGAMIFEGHNSWDDGIVRGNITENEGLLLLFQYSGTSPNIEIELTKGDWNSSGWRLWGLTNWGNWTAVAQYGSSSRTYTSPTLRANTWYYLLFRIGNDGRFYTQVWPRDNPTRYLVNLAETPPSGGWDNGVWDFVIKVNRGTLTADTYQELHFPANYTMPSTPPAPASVQTYEAQVASTLLWPSTNIQVRAGDRITITYLHGTWRLGRDFALTDASGGSNSIIDFHNVNARHGSMIARVGSTGFVYAVGNARTFTARNGGTLFLSINDDVVNDNSGVITVQVQIEPSTATPTATRTPRPTVAPTNTPRPTRTPAPTALPTSAAFGSTVQTVFQDTFNRTSLGNQWQNNYRSTIQVSGGKLTLSGNTPTRENSIISRTGIQGGDGILVLFQNRPGNMGLYLDNRVASTSTAYRQWGIAQRTTTGWDMACQGTTECNSIRDFTLTRDHWYYLLLRVSSLGTFHIQLWDRDDPSHFVVSQSRSPAGSSWDNVNWRFVIQRSSGTFIIDSYEEMHFPSAYFTPQTPPIIPARAGTGLWGEYYNNDNFTNRITGRVDGTINFNWNEGVPLRGVGADTFSIRWTGQIEPLYSEEYTFILRTDDGARLWVNGQRIINSWSDQSGDVDRTGRIRLQAGQRYDIRLEYYENTGGAKIAMWWQSTSQRKQIVPSTALYPAEASTATATPTRTPRPSATPTSRPTATPRTNASTFLGVLFQQNFEQTTSSGISGDGRRTVESSNGIWCMNARSNWMNVGFGLSTWDDYSVDIEVRITATGDGHSAILTRLNPNGLGYRHAIMINSSGSGWSTQYYYGGNGADLGGSNVNVHSGEWHHLRAEVEGNVIRTFVDEVLIATRNSDTRSRGTAAVEAAAGSNVCIDNVVVRSLNRTTQSVANARRGTASGSVNMRSGAGTQFNRVSGLTNGEEVFILAYSADRNWVYVRKVDSPVQGWVATQYMR
ncbi:MAG: SH3 domain-containing protein [Anaerolineae bacterium]|nr:SH3 domain-containing protein [Anaerolineae bacterium]